MTCRWCEEREAGGDYSLLTQQRLEGDKTHELLLGEEGALISVLLHPECLEKGLGAVVEEFKDAPPRITDVDLEECVTCGGGILEGESFVLLSLGHLVADKHGRPKYENKSEDEGIMCLHCARTLGTFMQVYELVVATEPGYCGTCSELTCWRDGERCPCPCHGVEEEEDGFNDDELDGGAGDGLLCPD